MKIKLIIISLILLISPVLVLADDCSDCTDAADATCWESVKDIRNITKRDAAYILCQEAAYTDCPCTEEEIIEDFLETVDPGGETGEGIYADDYLYNLEVPIGRVTQVKEIGDYIKIIYNFGISITGILAAIMIMVAGFQWIFAGGNEKIIGSAKERITSAIIGLVLALASYLILYTINPQLVFLPSLLIEKIVPNYDPTVAEYDIDGCDLDGGDISSYILNIDNCAEGVGKHGVGTGLTRSEIAAAINQYNGDVSPVFMGAIMLSEAMGDGTNMCSNSWSTFDNKDGTQSHACGAVQMIPGTAYYINQQGNCGLNLTGTYSYLGDRTYNEADCLEIIKNPQKAICLLGTYLNYLQDHGADTEAKLAAAYNGGENAIKESTTCPGQLSFECQAIEGFAETRNYVPNVSKNKNKVCTYLGGTVGE